MKLDYIGILQIFDQVYIEELDNVFTFYDEKGKEYKTFFADGSGKYGFWFPKNFSQKVKYIDFFNTKNNDKYTHKVYRYRSIRLENFISSTQKQLRYAYFDRHKKGDKGWYLNILQDLNDPDYIFN